MECREVVERASDLIDGDLSWMQALRLRVHMLACRDCAPFMRQLRITDELIRAASCLDEGSRGGDLAGEATSERIVREIIGRTTIPGDGDP